MKSPTPSGQPPNHRTLESGDRSADWQKAQQVLEALSNLNLSRGNLKAYLEQIANGVSYLLALDWSVVTLCQQQQERVMASSIPLVDENPVYSLHGTLTETVFQTASTLIVENAAEHPEFGAPPEGYNSYLGVPMITPSGEVLGTVCSFSAEPRKFTEAEVCIAGLFAERAASAIESYQLFKQVQHFNENLEAEILQRTEELRLAQSRLIDKERLAAIGEFAAMIVHEISNPVTTILMGLTALKPEFTNQRNQRRIALALEETERLQTMIKEILLYSKPQALKTTRLEVNNLMVAILERLEDIPAGAGKRLVFEPCPEPLHILADKDKLNQVMINLVRNAFEAISVGETVNCSIIKETSEQVCLRVQNWGKLIPVDVLPLLNQPFYSTKIGGTGLGLAVVRRIVAAHGGSFSIDSCLETGTVASVRLPVAF
jgi:hypothetical protein